jgi:hypothetical protein
MSNSHRENKSDLNNTAAINNEIKKVKLSKIIP